MTLKVRHFELETTMLEVRESSNIYQERQQRNDIFFKNS